MKFSNTIKTVLKIYQKYVKNSVWFGKRVSSLLFFLLGLTSSFIAARAFAAGGILGFFRAVTLQRKISQQLPAPYKRLHSIDGLKQTEQRQNDWTAENLTNNKRLFNCDNGPMETHQWHYESS